MMNDLHNELESTPPGFLPPASTSFHRLTLTPHTLSFCVKGELCPSCQALKDNKQELREGRAVNIPVICLPWMWSTLRLHSLTLRYNVNSIVENGERSDNPKCVNT
ncbi:hypothetical protein YC2023_011626 [Brassica napus]